MGLYRTRQGARRYSGASINGSFTASGLFGGDLDLS
jgi:hypothetical protein